MKNKPYFKSPTYKYLSVYNKKKIINKDLLMVLSFFGGLILIFLFMFFIMPL